jgi:hypothetical protein
MRCEAHHNAATKVHSGSRHSRRVIRPAKRPLTAVEFHRLADVPPEVEWFANLFIQHQGQRRNAVARAAMLAKTYRA